jgi:hypothetical protein
MTLPVTAALAGLCLFLSVLFGWLGSRPARPHREPRLVPWRFLMLLAFTAMVALLVHVVALFRDPLGPPS